MSHQHNTEELEGVTFWEKHYGQSERVWSGKVNKVIEDLVAPLTPGTSLDIGCGEGGDVLWLASNGWQATGLDISPTAISRAVEEAKKHGIDPSAAQFVASDLDAWDTKQSFDLVTLSFFQAPFQFPRAEFLRKAASFVAPGGHLLALSHASLPSFAQIPEHELPIFPSPEQELEALDLDPVQWSIHTAELRERTITAPNGEPAVMEDSVVFVQRNK
ncbi:bifunctional 2-polyprenyl-6-hydroxyphenol methylase/3-demethylubiquinol 3-O-methyltransferase UbiG [Glutamicibacter sp. M10]|uniref:class I SAM-dependent methyltransferase n=1 Tax=Glutamicibacter sp. M10 TaxID=3023076 RepID=UPI0021C68212|nr:class I SAM-dependent methyltransferase [Glutamicibacter sp. M10]UXN32564.1 class I SAM-dependent methyltransferase [Glutamicibacter sp. M10]